jgi:cysteine-rich repeat protein
VKQYIALNWRLVRTRSRCSVVLQHVSLEQNLRSRPGLRYTVQRCALLCCVFLAIGLLGTGCKDDEPKSEPPFHIVSGILPGKPDSGLPIDVQDAAIPYVGGDAGACGDGVRNGIEECDDGNNDDADGCSQCRFVTFCGDGIQNGDEECDTGGDSNICRGCRRVFVQMCGDQIISGDEQCDADSGVCQDCMLVDLPVCGNATREVSEQCDDGNLVDDDGCDNGCHIRTCGDGVVTGKEECDPPSDSCTVTCKFVSHTCGDHIVQPENGETCEDLNDVRGDGCYQCLTECGNGKVEPLIGEECEPGITQLKCNKTVRDVCLVVSDDTTEYEIRDSCDNRCQRRAACGDGRLDVKAGEQCDPPGTATCTAACRLSDPVCGNHALERGEQCDPPDGTTCGTTCLSLVCGNGTLDGTEQCDPPDGEICDASCNYVHACVPSVVSQNLVSGSFDSGFSDWISQDARIQLQFNPMDGATKPGSLSVTVAAGASSAPLEVRGATQCITIARNAVYDVSALYKFPANTGSTSGANISLFIYNDASCSGSPVSPANSNGPRADVKNEWTPYSFSVDTAPLGAGTGPVSMAIRLNLWRPIALPQVTVLWDDVQLLRHGGSGSLCGDCQISPGEDCDDGNNANGDGCSSKCRAEQCGNNSVDFGEFCDDGNTLYGDGCDPDCTVGNACRSCSFRSCIATADTCYNLPGAASNGPRKGTARALLCGGLTECVNRTGCAGNTAASVLNGLAGPRVQAIENCYCGTAGADCFEPGRANGSCRAEVEAALETIEPSEIFGRLSGSNPSFPVFAAAAALQECARSSCQTSCGAALTCGNGIRQDRTSEFFASFSLQGTSCTSQLCETPGLGCGCFFEQCDDANGFDGDGCDTNCFTEICGNGMLQLGEQCDDGNLTPGDGCSATCKNEWQCGDSNKQGTEQCDDGNVRDGDGCDRFCFKEECGNGRVQPGAGEECDPPDAGGVTCLAGCKLPARDACTQCLLRTDIFNPGNVKVDESLCPGLSLLDVSPFTVDTGAGHNHTKCLQNKECKALWECELRTRCAFPTPGSTPSSEYCYCGPDIANCIDDPAFKPVGACKNEVLAAYVQGVGGQPNRASDVFFLMSDPNYAALSTPGLLNYCLEPTFLDLSLCNGRVPRSDRISCAKACFGTGAVPDTQILPDGCNFGP